MAKAAKKNGMVLLACVNKGIILENIHVPEIVLENAKKQVYYEYYTAVETEPFENR